VPKKDCPLALLEILMAPGADCGMFGFGFSAETAVFLKFIETRE